MRNHHCRVRPDSRIILATSPEREFMEKRTFGKTGLVVSPLGFGGAPAAYLAAERQRTASMINKLLDAGMNVIDTAASYPGSERFIGENLLHRREGFVPISKCGSEVPQSGAPA